MLLGIHQKWLASQPKRIHWPCQEDYVVWLGSLFISFSGLVVCQPATTNTRAIKESCLWGRGNQGLHFCCSLLGRGFSLKPSTQRRCPFSRKAVPLKCHVFVLFNHGESNHSLRIEAPDPPPWQQGSCEWGEGICRSHAGAHCQEQRQASGQLQGFGYVVGFSDWLLVTLLPGFRLAFYWVSS